MKGGLAFFRAPAFNRRLPAKAGMTGAAKPVVRAHAGRSDPKRQG
jgi:hypothetical protein